MSKKKVLFVTEEMKPYTEETLLSELARKLPQYAQEEGFELRVLMPKFGIINERRHRLHEVVRLSGMNIIVDDEDYPLIIKVASLPGARMQVYFLDNEEFFKRKAVFQDENASPFQDNAERLVFFCKGVMETVKKFGWPPDIVHLHGQMTSLIPLYMKKAYRNDPVFRDAKIIYSVYNNDIGHAFDNKFMSIAAINDLEEKDLIPFKHDSNINLDMGAIMYSDAVLSGNESSNEIVSQYVEEKQIPFQTYSDDIDNEVKNIIGFYKTLLTE